MILTQENSKVRLTLNDVITHLTGDFFIVTKKKVANKDEVFEFVAEARAKKMNDFNIAMLIKHNELGFLTTALK